MITRSRRARGACGRIAAAAVNPTASTAAVVTTASATTNSAGAHAPRAGSQASPRSWAQSSNDASVGPIAKSIDTAWIWVIFGAWRAEAQMQQAAAIDQRFGTPGAED